ncbi:MAG: hypothetical protein ACTSR3_15245 [Candidatus Helarchaeota archaeon]
MAENSLLSTNRNVKLDTIHRQIIRCAQQIFKKKHILSSQELLRLTKNSINASQKEIIIGINYLLKNKYFIEGSKLTKNDVMKNNTRLKIFNYITQNPGAHLNEIMKKCNTKPHATRWHLSILKDFNFIRTRKFSNFLLFYPAQFEEELEKPIIISKRDKLQKIVSFIEMNPNKNISEMARELDIAYSTLQNDLRQIEKTGLINKLHMGTKIHYSLNYELYNKLKNYLITKEKATNRKDINVVRAYDYIGGTIRLKVSVRNNSENTISHISCSITSSEQFDIKKEVKKIKVLTPGESRGVDFTLIPLTCGKTEVYGAVTYKDSKGKPHSLIIDPVKIWIKCPLINSETIDISQIDNLKRNLIKAETIIPLNEIEPDKMYKIARDQVSSLDLSEILDNSSELIAIYSGRTKITEDLIIIEIIVKENLIIRTYTVDIKQATGFIAWLKNLIQINIDIIDSFNIKIEQLGGNIVEIFKLGKIIDILIKCFKNKVTYQEIINILDDILQKAKIISKDLRIINDLIKWREKVIYKFGIEREINQEFENELFFMLLLLKENLLNIVNSEIKIFLGSIENQDFLKIEREKIEPLLHDFKANLISHEETYLQQSLSYLIIIMKESGLPIYSQKISGEKIEVDLVSGFLEAISNFGIEVQKEKTIMNKITFQDFEILLNEGEFIRAAVITKGKIINLLNVRIEDFIKEFEAKYKEKLINWTGNLENFKDSKYLIEKYFNSNCEEKF